MNEIWESGLAQLVAGPLILREVRSGDAADLYAAWSDPKVTEYWSSAPMTSLHEAEAKVADIQRFYAERSGLQWAIALAADGPVIGTCTLWKIDQWQRRAEMGIILSQAYWGQGYASQALACVIKYAFKQMQLHRLEADIDPDNAASLRLFERSGFLREGLLRERWFMNEQWRDTVLLGLISSEWPSSAGR